MNFLLRNEMPELYFVCSCHRELGPEIWKNSSLQLERYTFS